MSKPNQYITPPILAQGALVRIVAPAGKISQNKVYNAINGLYAAGYRVIAGNHVFDEYHQFAGTDNDRLEDLQEAFDDPDCSAILMARGGYGLVRIIDKLDFTGFINNPKWVLGFSDITLLHSQLHLFGFQSIHAAMCAAFTPGENSAQSLASMLNTLQGKPLSYGFAQHHLNRYGSCQGVLTGGNIAILCSGLSSSSDVDTANKVLFLEDVGEYLYRLDRMMYSLKRAGKLDKIKGLLIGGLTAMKDSETPFGQDAADIVSHSVAEYDYPVCFGFPAGHQFDNQALVLGRTVIMASTPDGSTLNFV
jgi:muramoyltetrapeptide carboxypeptidase